MATVSRICSTMLLWKASFLLKHQDSEHNFLFLTITSHSYPWFLMKRSVCLHPAALATWWVKWPTNTSTKACQNSGSDSSIGVVVLCSCLIVRPITRMKNLGSLSLCEWHTCFNWIYISLLLSVIFHRKTLDIFFKKILNNHDNNGVKEKKN